MKQWPSGWNNNPQREAQALRGTCAAIDQVDAIGWPQRCTGPGHLEITHAILSAEVARMRRDLRVETIDLLRLL
jgi:hypothetical protein